MNWYPLRLTTPIKSHAFGGRAIVERLGRSPAPSGRSGAWPPATPRS
ncbi:hypothetical protein ABT299_00795 [Spirillospora sp. NPDC000708]